MLTQDRLAFDRASVREKDEFGRLHIKMAHISKANICPYYGREIPGGETLGLQPERIYRLLRDPEELAKAAPTFNRVPLMEVHVATSAEAPQKDKVVGTVGSEAIWNAPYLDNSLAVWDADAIDLIESDDPGLTKRELSCGYSYTAVMTPGEYEGEPYDGRMTNIRGNHVALVYEGRAGRDVVIGDSALRTGGGSLVEGWRLRSAPAWLARDAGFNEGDHPRAENGKFGSGGGGSGKKFSDLTDSQKSNIREMVANRDTDSFSGSIDDLENATPNQVHDLLIDLYEREANDRTEARDAGFNEGDHPRAENGQFGSGGGGGSEKEDPRIGTTQTGTTPSGKKIEGKVTGKASKEGFHQIRTKKGAIYVVKLASDDEYAEDCTEAHDHQMETRTMKIKTQALTSRKAMMAQGALAVYLAPLLAADAAIDLGPVMAGVNRTNFKAKRPAILSRLQKVTAGKLAEDADLDNVAELLEKLDGMHEGGEDEVEEKKACDEEEDEADKKKAEDSEEEKKAEDSEEEAAMKKEAEDKARDEEMKDKVDKSAMDAAIAKAKTDTRREVMAEMNAQSAAKEAVRPLIGEVPGTFGSASEIYKMALDSAIENGADIDLSGVPTSAYPALVRLLPKPGEVAQSPRTQMAEDSASAGSVAELFPSARRIRAV